MYRVVYAERSFYEWHELNGGSELHYRVFMNDFHSAQSLLDKNNSLIDIKDKTKSTALHIAVMKNYLDLTKLLICKHASLDLTDNQLRTPLHWAAIYNRTEMVDLLIGNHIDPLDDKNRTPLFWAAVMDHIYIVEKLIRHGANHNLAIHSANNSATDVIKYHLLLPHLTSKISTGPTHIVRTFLIFP